MENKMVTYRIAEGREREVFAQYLLPVAADLARKDPDHILVPGAVWGDAACGAAALRLVRKGEDAPVEAELLCLYVDPKVRRNGVAEGLLEYCLDQAAEAGAELFTARYTAEGEQLEALDGLFRKLGYAPDFRLPIYVMESSKYYDAPVVRKAFSPKYQRPDHIVPLSALTPEQKDRLYSRADLPEFLHPAGRLGLNPDLSLVYLMDGEAEGIWLCASTAVGHYSLLGVWRSEAAPVTFVQEMLLAHINHCWYHGGGEISYYMSPAVPYADKLIQAYSKGNYRLLEEHSVELFLGDAEEEEDEEDESEE